MASEMVPDSPHSTALYKFLVYECRRRGRLHRLYGQLDSFAVADVLLQFNILDLGFLHPDDYAHLDEAYTHGNLVATNRKSGFTPTADLG